MTCEHIWISDKRKHANKRGSDIVGSEKSHYGGHEQGGSKFGKSEKEQQYQCAWGEWELRKERWEMRSERHNGVAKSRSCTF